MNKFILTFDNNLDSIFCSHLINKFENDSNKYIGWSGGKINLDKKNTYDLIISNNDSWINEDKKLCDRLSLGLKKYGQTLLNYDIIKESLSIFNYNIIDTGFKIQKYIKNVGYYNWHNDFVYSTKGVRIFTFIWYLNNIELGGETEFIDGTIIKPKKGSLLIFPADFTYVHRGNIPISDNKYICNGWFYINSFSKQNS